MTDEVNHEEKENTFTPRRERHSTKKENVKQKKDPTKNEIKKEITSTVLQLLAVIIVLIGIRHFLFVPVSVDGDSMEPTLQTHNRLLLNKIGKIERFDIVVFPDPDSNSDSKTPKQFIKRVIGLPGDRIRVESDHLYVNDEIIEETYLKKEIESMEEWSTYTEDFSLESVTGQEIVPDNTYFLLGDNRGNSKDSRIFGFVPADSIMGKTNWRLWPLNEFGSINKPPK